MALKLTALDVLHVDNVFLTLRQILPDSSMTMLRTCCGRVRLLFDKAAGVDTNHEKSRMMGKRMPLVHHGAKMNNVLARYTSAKTRFSKEGDPALVEIMKRGQALITKAIMDRRKI